MNNLKYEYGNFPNESFISRESLKLNSLRSSVLSAKSMHKHKLPVTGGPYSLFSLKLWWTRWIGIDTPALCLVWLASCCSSRSPSSTHASQCRWRTDCTKKPSFFGFIRLKRETRLMYPGLGDVMRCDVDPLVVSIAGRHSLYHFLSRQVSILITSGHRSIQNTKKVIFPKIGHKRFLFSFSFFFLFHFYLFFNFFWGAGSVRSANCCLKIFKFSIGYSMYNCFSNKVYFLIQVMYDKPYFRGRWK